MIKKNLIPGLIILLISFFVFFSCTKKDTTPIETCFDNIKNQNEVKTDCGGVCIPCAQSMTAKINGAAWVADTSKIKASYGNGSATFRLTGNTINTLPQISLVYLGSFSVGTHNLDHSSSFTPDISSFVTFNSGTITLSEIDTRNNLISGTFSFTAANSSTSATYNITEGAFTNLNYRIN